MAELDSTYALLSSNLPVGGDPNSVKKKTKKGSSDKSPAKPESEKQAFYVDSEEDEIFFGEKTEKELHGKNAK